MGARENTLKRLDALWFKILKLERGAIDEISSRAGIGLGTFHILCKSNYPRLRYSRENCLLVNWMPHHYNWHHYTSNDQQYKVVEEGIIRKRGKDYKQKLLLIEKTMPKHTLTYLKTLEFFLKIESQKER